MPEVAKPVRRERAARLREVGQAAAGRFLAGQVGARIAMLTEAADDGRSGGNSIGHSIGHSEHFAPVRLAGPWAPGQVVAALVTGATATHLLAETI
jgi:threonylcarbamoyladenosine tRNA methylthiotransferase MtaB